MVIDGDLSIRDPAAQACADGVPFLLALFVDLAARPCAERAPVEAFQRGGAGCAGFAIGAIGQQPGDPDLGAGYVSERPVLHRGVRELPTERSDGLQ
jgi:hypothetical protein